MKQILQDLKSGDTKLIEIPCPRISSNHLCIKTCRSLISAGTERMLIDFGRAGYIEKARQQPDKVKQVIQKIQTDGLQPTIEAVRAKLDQPMPLGYCNAGIVTDIGSAALKYGFKIGDRVISNGPHAEMVCVPPNLCALIPDGVSDEDASFTVLGAVAMQGVRLAKPGMGDCFVVTGLGLVGLLTVQLLLADGCRVLGIDFDSQKCALARSFGAETVDLSNGEDALSRAKKFSRGRGVDGVILAAATKSNEPVQQAALMCRKRGRIVLVGVTGLNLSRDDFFKKEISFQVSCSYGPGRYDPEYEENGNDYPVGYVRWTEQRNFEAVLDLMADGKIDVSSLVSHRYRFEDAEKAYSLIAENQEAYVGIILEYKDDSRFKAEGSRRKEKPERTIQIKSPEPQTSSLAPQTPVIAVIGAGDFTARVILPALKKTGVRLKTIASSGGVSSTHLGKKFGFEESTTDSETIFSDPEINTVFITTRHNTHFRFVLAALKAGKHVFVEKPLCLTMEELEEIELAADPRRPTQTDTDFSSADSAAKNMSSQSTNQPILMVGFNRRFAPHIQKMKSLITAVNEPKAMIMTVNAGIIPADHWTQDPAVGGGRIIGEACHFIDLLKFLAGSEIISYEKIKLGSGIGDTLSIQLSFADGSIGTLHYLANGNKRFPKERLEIFCAGRILQMDNFRKLRGYGWPDFKKMNLFSQNKGHEEEVKRFIDSVRNGKSAPIPFEEIVETTKISLNLASD